MHKEINEIDKTWYEIQVGLQVADFLGASQRIRKLILQLKMLKLNVGILMDLPYPQLALLEGTRKNPDLKVWGAEKDRTTQAVDGGGEKCL